MRRSTVLSLPLQLVFPDLSIDTMSCLTFGIHFYAYLIIVIKGILYGA